MTLALNQLVFRLAITPGRAGVSARHIVFFMSSGRLVAGALLVVGATRRSLARRSSNPRATFFRGAAVVVGSLAAIQTVLWIFRNHLPALASSLGVAAANKGSLPSLTAVDYVLGIGGALLYLGAATLELASMRTSPDPLPWLPAALVLAAYSHLHYMFLPIVFPNLVTTGDLLRLLFSLVLVAGFFWGVRQAFKAERDSWRELSHAYERERLRVEELEHMDRSRAELFNILTHELLHPVAAIRGFAVTLSQRWDQLDDRSRLSMIERMARESSSLRDLAEEAVTVTDLEGSRFSLSPGPEGAVDLVLQAAESAGELDGRLKIHVEEGCESAVVNADHARALQVFRNLLSNAEKYSERGTPVELRLSRDDGEVIFTVTNQGAGLAKEDLAGLFQPFSRVTSAHNGHVRGSGLGLYICKQIVQAHGGRIWIQSEPGRETSAAFTLLAVDGRR